MNNKISNIKESIFTKNTLIPSATQSNQEYLEVAFIDTVLANWQDLVSEMPTEVEVVLLDANQDGLAQIATWAKTNTKYNAIHILSHGNSGTVQLGTATLNENTLSEYQHILSEIGQALTEDGDVLFYGCDVAKGKKGFDLIGKLSQAIGANIAASDNPTGNHSFGGDWILETSEGIVDTTPLTFVNYFSVLANGDFIVGDGSGGGGGGAAQGFNGGAGGAGGGDADTLTGTAGNDVITPF